MNESEPSMRCRENEHSVRTTVLLLRRRNVAETCLLATWQTSYRRHEFYSGLVMEQGKSCRDGKGKVQAR
jgi:hypothetical protein